VAFGQGLTLLKTISLKKDETKKILVKYDGYEKLFKFRWTLFINNTLTVLKSYDFIVSQTILYDDYKNRSFRFYLKPKGASNYNVPYILVKFKKFDFKQNKAIFELYIFDREMEIDLEYLN